MSPKIDLDGLRRDRDQLWAEAYARLKAGEQWWPTDEEEKLLAVEQDKRRRQDTWEPIIEAGLLGAIETTVEDVLTNVLKIEAKHADQGDRIRVANALKVFGWKAEIRKIGGVTKRIYARPKHKDEPVSCATRQLSAAQEAAVDAFTTAVPVTMTTERLPDGQVIRVWREIEAKPGDANDTLLDMWDV